MASYPGLCKKPYSACKGISSLCASKRRSECCLEEYFRFSSFLPGQLDAILPILHGKDVFVRMATGSGKSLCMFIPVLASHSTAMGVVFSPLIGLMEQQVRQYFFCCIVNQ